MLKYVNTGIVFQEIPDEVTLAGCHSSYLAGDIGTPLTTGAIDDFIQRFGTDITCLCFMGGDADPAYVDRLAEYMHSHHPRYKVGWYSGRLRLSPLVDKTNFDYIKIGPYIAHLGPLKAKTTNQRLYRREHDNQFTDITSRFWKH